MRAAEFTEADLGTQPRRAARAGSRPARGHKPVPRYRSQSVDEAVAANFKIGNLSLNIDDHVIEQTYFKEVDHHQVDAAIRKLKRIESELNTLSPGEKSWVLDPDSGVSLGVRKLNGVNRYLVATVHPDRTYDSDVAEFELPAGPLSEDEQLFELDFMGSQCTKDCSGHRAGYAWSVRRGRVPAQSWSPSFNKGAALAWSGK
jgi:hypothetical protein